MPRKYTDNMTVFPVRVTLDADRRAPAAFHWREKAYLIAEIQECWRLAGAWWDGEGERTFYRVLAQTGGIFELSYDHAGKTWLLERIED